MESLIFLLLLFGAMWFIVIRPQQRRVREQRNLIESLEAGDVVVTAGGLVGTIKVLTPTEITLEVAPGVELRLLRGAISRRFDDGPAGEPEDLA